MRAWFLFAGTHYMRAWNNKLQVWGSAKKRKEHHLEPANPTEEGLASLHSIIYRKDPCLWRCAMLYYTIYQVSAALLHHLPGECCSNTPSTR